MKNEDAKVQFFSGDTQERAVLAAARQLQVDPGQVVFEKVEKRHGFVKRRREVIRVDVEASMAPPPAADSSPSAAAPPAGPPSEAKAEPASDERPVWWERSEAEPSEGGAAVPAADGAPAPKATESSKTAEAAEDGQPAQALQAPDVEGSASMDDEPAAPADSPDQDVAPASDEVDAEPDRDAEEPAAPEQESAAEDEESAPELTAQEVEEAGRRVVSELLELAGLELSIEVEFVSGRVEVELSGLDHDLLVEDEGQALLSIQHLVPRVLQGEIGRFVPCRVDSEGFQEHRERRLEALARRVADQVRERGRSRTLRPMTPADRRVVHLALADDPDVETESQGNGFYKRVCVRCS